MTLFFIAIMAGVAYYVFTQAVQGGELVTVPDVTGMSITQASNVLTQSGLVLGSQRQVINENVPQYHVIHQSRSANNVVRTGRKVNLTISQGREFVEAPRWIGKSLDDARSEIDSSRFLSGSIARVHNKAPRDTVLAQDPAPAIQISHSREIHLLVSDGPKTRTVIMPDLVDKSLEEAQLILSTMDVQAIPYTIKRIGEEYEVVLDQFPPPGTVLVKGQEVTFDIRLRPTSFLPNARRKVLISYVVPFAEREVEVRVEKLDESGRRTIIYPQISDYINNQPPRIIPGSTMTFSTIAFTNEATVEFYIDRRLHRSYFFSRSNAPVITDHQTFSDTAKSSELNPL